MNSHFKLVLYVNSYKVCNNYPLLRYYYYYYISIQYLAYYVTFNFVLIWVYKYYI